MTQRWSLGDTLPSGADNDSTFERLSPNQIADLLLLALLRRKASALFVEPVASRHGIRYEDGGTAVALTSLPAELADAVVMRLALIAELDVTAQREQLGRIRLRPARSDDGQPSFSATSELLLSVRRTSRGLAAELHRLAGFEDQAIVEAAGRSAAVAGQALQRIGPYRVLGELGRGGMGVVYRAEHIVLQKPVAIKVLHTGIALHPEAAARFIMEARAACRARHPGIVDVTDFGHLADRRAYLVMELVEGETLERRLRNGALAPVDALHLTIQLADALQSAADAGVIHRDLKPANIFLDERGRVKIGDFGVAKLIDPASRVQEAPADGIVGTVGYMSPEQACAMPTDARTDLYSLGCVLFELLTGRPPYDGATAKEVLALHVNAPIPKIVTPEGALPEIVERPVVRAMQKRPEDRYASAKEMLADLELALDALRRTGWRRWLPE